MTKKQLARRRGIARSTLYYRPQLPLKDEILKNQILQVWNEFPSYGHKRLAMCLKVNKKRIRRVMKIFRLKVPRRRGRRPKKSNDLGNPAVSIPNLIPAVISYPDQVWAQDFTYIYFAGSWWFVATVIDLYTREILGFAFSKHHNKHLILDVLNEALATGRKPEMLHSDQGSEYQAYDYWDLIKAHGILLSYSKKASPWQNSYQESFYSNFKLDLGYTNQFETVGELIEAVYQTIYIYNHKRIHTKLKMSPKQYYQQYQLTHPMTAQKVKETVS